MDKLRKALSGDDQCDEESGIITQVILSIFHCRISFSTFMESVEIVW